MFLRKLFRRKTRDEKLKEQVYKIQLEQRKAFLRERARQKKLAIKFIKNTILKEFHNFIIDCVINKKDKISLDVGSLASGYQKLSNLSWRDEYYNIAFNMLQNEYPSFKFNVQRDRPDVISVYFEQLSGWFELLLFSCQPHYYWSDLYNTFIC